MANGQDLSAHVALVTGASRGIGAASALTLAESGAAGAVNYRDRAAEAVLPTMRARKWGRIVNISSGAARGAGAIGVHYNASKAGIEGLTRGYAARLVKEGITVNAVAPSLIATDMMGGRTDLARNIPP